MRCKEEVLESAGVQISVNVDFKVKIFKQLLQYFCNEKEKKSEIITARVRKYNQDALLYNFLGTDKRYENGFYIRHVVANDGLNCVASNNV